MATRVDPVVQNKFFLKIDSYGEVGSMLEVSAPAMEAEVVELLQSTEKGQQVRIKTLGAQRLKSGKVTLKYALFKGDKVLTTWRKAVEDGKMSDARKNMTLFVYKSDGSVAFEVHYENCFPSKFSIDTLSTKSNEVVTATVDIEYENIKFALV